MPVRQNKGETPPLSPDHADLDPYERCNAFFAKKVEHSPENHRAAKRAALHRDGYCCVATNVIDSDYKRTIPREVIDAHVQAGFGIDSTKLAHIFPPFAARGLETEPEGRSETDYSSAVCATVKSFAHIVIPAELSGTQFHRLSNILTLSCGMWALFNELEVWFEEVPDMPNSYYVCESQRGYLWGIRNRLITFTPRDGLEVPDPRYLKLHAVVCRVALMSGVSKYLNSYEREHEQRGTLALSGASADFLTARLNKVLVEG
ncbi:hypothetical protein BDN70DRAFT_902706 [Pholiota conissans]|uniref:HNH nuclease domain-containing protein n=1 Tax=Pholiota conissans TaxID=109636 RepID=A0A9P6CZC2_9AGAR|nr:hypothetical protein BDN70DRAFT_902706 [Pholiota conissans]